MYSKLKIDQELGLGLAEFETTTDIRMQTGAFLRTRTLSKGKEGDREEGSRECTRSDSKKFEI